MTLAPPGAGAWSLRGLARAAAIGAVALGAGAAAGYAVSHERGPGSASSSASPPARAAAGPVELAVIAPIAPGAAIAGYTVDFVRAIGPEGQITIECSRGAARARIELARLAAGAPDPPAKAGPYAVYYGGGAPPGDGERLARAVAAVVADHLDRDVPARLGPLAAPRAR